MGSIRSIGIWKNAPTRIIDSHRKYAELM